MAGGRTRRKLNLEPGRRPSRLEAGASNAFFPPKGARPSGALPETDYWHRVRDIHWLQHCYPEEALPPGSPLTEHGSPELKQKRPRRPRFIRPVCKLGEAPHFLQQLQHIHSGGHAFDHNLCRKSRAMARMRKKSFPIPVAGSILENLSETFAGMAHPHQSCLSVHHSGTSRPRPCSHSGRPVGLTGTNRQFPLGTGERFCLAQPAA